MAIASPFPDVEIPDLPVYDFLFRDLPDSALTSTAVLDSVSGRTTSYGELLDQVDRIAGALAARGIRAGDVVALHSPNSPAFVALFHGILRAGATVTTVNSLYTGDEIGRQLADSRARLAITVGALRENMSAGAAAAGVGTVMVVDGAPGHESLADWLGEGRAAPEVSIDPMTHLAVLPYSSGTTGAAKGVMLTHHNLIENVAPDARRRARSTATR